MSIMENMPFVASDERVRKFLLPEKIVKTGGNVKNTDALLRAKPLQIGLNENDLCTLSNDGGENAFLVLDFGREIHGGIRLLNFVSEKTAYPRVRLTFGESLSEAMSAVGQKGACNDYSVRDFEIPLPSYSDQEWGQTGFRFVKIELCEQDAGISLKSALAVFIYRDLEYKGSFRCSDEKINKIYDTAAYTCHLNLQHMVWDGIKRDRLVWIGDMHPEMLTVRSVFGPLDIIAKSLDFARDQAPLPLYMNGMASYSLWWLIIVWDWYFYTGDIDFLKSEGEYARSLLKQLCGKVGEDGGDCLESYFLDWPTHQKPISEKSGVRALLKIALSKGQKLCSALGDKELSALCGEKAEALAKLPPEHQNQKQTAAVAALSGLLSDNEAAKVIKDGGVKGLSSYLLFYTLKELSKTDPECALSLLKDYECRQLDRGATTFFEDYDVSWEQNAGDILSLSKNEDIHGDRGDYCYKGFRHSLCHGWASGAVPFLAECVAGIEIAEPGCKKIRISPKMCGLDFIKVSYPTPLGILKAEIRRSGNGFSTEYSAPEGMTVEIARAF